MKFENLKTEQKILILTCRLTFSKEDESLLKDLLKEKIDWFQVFNYAIKNKVAPLVYNNLIKRGYKDLIPYELARVMSFYYYATIERNKILQSEMSKVIDKLESNNIKCSPLKGAYLIPCMYKNMGIRTVHDIDCMISHSKAKELIEIMKEEGYSQGDYDAELNIMKPLSREKEILWKMKMNNLYPFKKIDVSPFVGLKVFDFSFSLDLDLDKKAVDEIISNIYFDNEYGRNILKPAHFFIHLCCHLFKEATTAVFIEESNDLNLIKFCDVREYILQKMNKKDMEEAISFSIDHKINKAIYYTVYYLKEIYDDGYEEEILSSLKIEDQDFLNQYGNRDFSKYKEWKKSFWQRIFSYNNADEIDEVPKYMEIK